MSNGTKHQNAYIQIDEYTRAIKIAYLVPIEETEQNQWILDAIFYESYTRWGGASTLLIPFSENKILDTRYEKWLSFFDPDLVYSYVDPDVDFISRSSELGNPAVLLRHRTREATSWRNFIPNWATYFSATPSLSTLLSPNSAYSRYQPEGAKKILITQYEDISSSRFLPDNFGVSHSLMNYTNPVHDLFDTVCYAKKQTKGIVRAGTEEFEDLSEILAQINTGKITTFSQLSKIHSNGIPKIESLSYSSDFVLVVGSSCADRIHFWNSRNLSPGWYELPTSYIVSKESLGDETFLKEIGQYFNRYNYLTSNSSQPRIALKSYSLPVEELFTIQKTLSEKKLTYNLISTDRGTFNSIACPSEKDFENQRFSGAESRTFTISANNNIIEPAKPTHFKYTPAKFENLTAGAWAVDLSIERQNSLSKYSNVADVWKLPRYNNVCRAFTDNISKVSKGNLLTIIPTQNAHKLMYKIFTPDDSTFFRHLILRPSIFSGNPNDLRSSLKFQAYEDMEISDKGQNLRGVVSMFDSFSDSYKLLTHKVWRTVLRNFYTKTSVTHKELFASVPSELSFKEKIKKCLGFENIGQAVGYQKNNFLDTLEYLVEKNIIFQVHRWRCKYCGHLNLLSIDELKKRNECSICRLEYFTPIDLDWEFKINSFVSSSLCERNGLPVLWALGWLHQNSHKNSFYYLPEVDLFEKSDSSDPKEEIDILCINDGLFYAVEVKKSATQIILKNDQVEKFIKKINILKPDAAALMFESFSDQTENIQEKEVKESLSKIIQRIKSETKLNTVFAVVANEIEEYRDGEFDLGVEGRRTQKILFQK